MSGTRVYIGTSGWVYRHWQGRFYPEGTPGAARMAYYAQSFSTVEVNNTFYQQPVPSTFEAWRDTSPSGFLFAIKANRYITHMKKLLDPEPSLDILTQSARLLREKLGPILFQLPPRWRRNVKRFREFLDFLPRDCRFAFEFREESWYDESIYRELQSHNAALCIHDFAQKQGPHQVTADFVYVRFHGPSGHYAGSYSDEVMRQWAHNINRWLDQGADVYVYFNNDDRAYAIDNARTLTAMLGH